MGLVVKFFLKPRLEDKTVFFRRGCAQEQNNSDAMG